MAKILILTCILIAILHFFCDYALDLQEWEETQTARCLIRKFLRNTRSLFTSVSVLSCDFSFLVKILNFEICSVLCLPVEKKAELASSVSFFSMIIFPSPDVCCCHLASLPFFSPRCIPDCTVAYLVIASFLDPGEAQRLRNFPKMGTQWLQCTKKGSALQLLGKCFNHSAVALKLHFSCSP